MKRHLGSASAGVVALNFALFICIAFLAALAHSLPALAEARASSANVESAANESPEEVPAYSIFYSPPERVDALFWAIVDCYPAGLDEAREWFLENCERLQVSIGTMQKAGRYVPPDYSGGPLFPDEAKLAALEESFGDMPEYWQARYFFARAAGKDSDIELLERAHGVAPDDSATLYLLAQIKAQNAEAASLESGDALKQQIERREKLRQAVEMMVQAAECEPSNAFYYYAAANLLGGIGGYEPVTELLKKGNAAPVNEVVDLFPLSYVKRNFRAIRDADDGSGKFRLLSFALMNAPLPNFIARRTVIRNYQVILNLTGDIDLLNTLHVYTSRMGQAKYAEMIHLLVAAVLNGMVQTEAAELGAIGSDADTLKVLSAMAGRRGSVRGIAFAQQAWRDFSRDEGLMAGAGSFGEEVTPEEEWDAYLQWWEKQMMEIAYVGPAMAVQFKMLEAYRYHEDGTIARVGYVQRHRERAAAN